jgi:hypothetical protein
MPRKHTTAHIEHFTPRASLAALGAKLTALRLFDPVGQHVAIRHEMAS